MILPVSGSKSSDEISSATTSVSSPRWYRVVRNAMYFEFRLIVESAGASAVKCEHECRKLSRLGLISDACVKYMKCSFRFFLIYTFRATRLLPYHLRDDIEQWGWTRCISTHRSITSLSAGCGNVLVAAEYFNVYY